MKIFNDNLINSIGNNAKTIVEIARQGNIPFIRIYDPLPPFPKFNIFGVGLSIQWGMGTIWFKSN